MKTVTYEIGTELKLAHGTALWAQEHARGKASIIYEVAGFVDDGTSMERISVRILEEQEFTFIGITPDLFEKA